MVIIKPWETKGYVADPPNERLLQVLLSPRLHPCRNIAIGMVTVPPGSASGMHRHEVEESWYIVSGKGKAQIGSEVEEIAEGMILWGPAGIPHQFINNSSGELKAIFIFTPPGEEEKILEKVRDLR